jgi:hypothetical protein
LNLKFSSILASTITVTAIVIKSLDVLPEVLVKKLEWFGDRSYSIYLVHMPILYVAKYSPVMEIRNLENRILQSILAVIASILLGALSYSKIENRFRDRGKVKHLRLKTIATSLILTLVGPLFLFLSFDRLTMFEIKKSGLPVPNKILPWNWDKECQFYSPQPNVNDQPCKYSNHNSGKSILLIGDSHAASISRAIISLGNSNDMDTFVFTFEGCGFVLSTNDFRPSYSYPYLISNCIKHNRSILNFVQERKPTLVIYMHRSSSIMVSPNNFSSRTHYNEMVKKNLDVLVKENSEVLHIGSTPELLPALTRIQNGLDSTRRFSEIPFEDDIFWKNRKATDYYLGTLDIFCPRKVCKNNSAKGWLFHDSDHLSEIGANYLLLRLAPLIKEIISEKS